MRILIVGSGVVGQSTGKGFARYGHDVIFLDKSIATVIALKQEGYQAFCMDDLLSKHDITGAIIFVCVPEKVVPDCVAELKTSGINGLLVIRSTMPPGSLNDLDWPDRHICANPEFLREAVAEFDFLNPPGIIIGECCKEHGDKLEALYKPLRKPIHRISPATAQMTKLAVNSYLACQISFWNQIKMICDEAGINSHEVGSLAVFGDGRVSPYGARMHGKPYGGKCLPKDVEQLRQLAEGVVGNHYAMHPLIDAIQKINQEYGGE